MPCCSANDVQLRALTLEATGATAESTADATTAAAPRCICRNGGGNQCAHPQDGQTCPSNLCRAGEPPGQYHARPLCPVHDYRPFGLDPTAATMQQHRDVVEKVLPTLKAAVKSLEALQATGELSPEELEWLRKLAP